MSEVIFSHPQVNNGHPLVVDTGANNIKWSYSLNTANWPTYAGEVVQILSVAINDVSILGTVSTYKEMEAIYSFFIEYVQIASQGRGKDPVAGVTAYNQQPMLFQYPHRGWTMQIQPRQLPAFRKGRDVVAPAWGLVAYVVDDDEDVATLKDLVLTGLLANVDGASEFELTGDIGFREDNPFSTPFPNSKDQFDAAATSALWKQYGDYFSTIIPSWTQSDFDSLTTEFGSKPAFLQWGQPSTDTQKKSK